MAQGTSTNGGRDAGENRAEDVQVRAAETRNDSPTAGIPIPRLLDDVEDSDVERGSVHAESFADQTQSAPRSSWRAIASLNFSARVAALSGDLGRQQSQSDRSR